jgi:hypothetical protein
MAALLAMQYMFQSIHGVVCMLAAKQASQASTPYNLGNACTIMNLVNQNNEN